MALLEIVNLNKIYGKHQALHDISMEINAGEIVALIGKNGAGKTTLLNIISSRIFPTSGDVIYKGTTLLQNESKLNEFGILIEPTFVPYLNAYENLAIIAELIGIREPDTIINELLDMVGLHDKSNKKTRTFSFGMKQRLGLAMSLLNNPHFLILDEPFVGLDPVGKDIFKDVLTKKAQKEGVGILFSSHDLEDVEEICDRVVMIDSGEKRFDGGISYDKRLVLKYDQSISDVDFEEISGVEVDKDRIVVFQADNIERVIAKTKELGMKIVDFEMEKDSLYDFFKK